MSQVEFSEDSGAGVITLADSESGNRLSLPFLKELDTALSALLASPSVRFILLRSNGPRFSLGMDLQVAADTEKEEDTLTASVSLYRKVLHALFTAPVPVVTLVQGEVKAGGTGLVFASDMVFATEDSSFELSEVLFGLIPANVLPYLIGMRVSPAKARYLILSAKRVEAAEAGELGLADEVFSAALFEKKVKKICKNLMRSAPEALKLTKSFTRQLMDVPFDTRLETAERIIIDVLRNESVRGEIRKFQEGELPSWFAGFRPEKPLTAFTSGEKDG